jgi:acetyltransferase-like isoleucine patch superfamily enzyme
VSIGRGVWIQTFDDDMVFSCKAGAEIRIGERCWFSGGIFGASSSITVGDHTLIGWGCMILDSDMHRLDHDAEPVNPAPVRIGSHVWMPSNITVLKGVRIGDHCVIGTGSLVTEDVPDHCLAAGRPARVIRGIGDRDQVE